MASSFSPTHAIAVSLDDEQDDGATATCPMCHTSATLSLSALEAGGDWRCVRCGQQWDARRLATVAAYAAWTVAHDRVDSRVTDDSPRPALVSPLRTERAGGRP